MSIDMFVGPEGLMFLGTWTEMQSSGGNFLRAEFAIKRFVPQN